MEKSFLVSKESKLAKDLDRYYEMVKNQKDFINKFFKENGIESVKYLISGSGSVNCPFQDWNRNEITLSIEPTEGDTQKYSNVLSKPSRHTGLCKFKKKSQIGKLFAQQCVNEKVVINLWKPRIGDYFESISFMRANWERFKIGDDYYLKVESEYLKSDDIPEGFTEIKLSEYYKTREEFEQKEQAG